MNQRKKNILFLCTGNSCRSQMAEAWTNLLLGEKYQAFSAGTDPKGMDLRTTAVMQEVGIDLSSRHTKRAEELADIDFDLVVTVCGHAQETCPVFPSTTEIVHMGFEDPPKLAENSKTEEEALDHYRRIRDEIRTAILSLLG